MEMIEWCFYKNQTNIFVFSKNIEASADSKNVETSADVRYA